MINFLTFLQEAHKTKESLSDYIKNVSDEEILEAIELYVQYRNISVYRKAENYKSVINTEYLHISELEQLLNIETE